MPRYIVYSAKVAVDQRRSDMLMHALEGTVKQDHPSCCKAEYLENRRLHRSSLFHVSGVTILTRYWKSYIQDQQANIMAELTRLRELGVEIEDAENSYSITFSTLLWISQVSMDKASGSTQQPMDLGPELCT
ncbi:hypothetical protein AC579_1204 [Pseudocercospora musae]|uniref:Uncharacterized protein n=1 Tax=Pseudocercospora musae TaxID=113226 RepID=A0A139I6K6_9PEZI|nr:hypothetical protein AC579_1204 [Pseudocercospora musae]